MDKVSSIAPLANQRSWSVMEKIGMTRITEFLHPLLADDKRLERCVLYEMKKS
jgi:RimJ/RimL family protein N-acetyltransferase